MRRCEKASIHFLPLLLLHWRHLTHQFIARDTTTDKHPNSTPMDNLDFPVFLMCRSFCAVGGSGRTCKEPLQSQGEHAKHTEESNPLPSCCKATALTAALQKTRAALERRGICSWWFSCCCCCLPVRPNVSPLDSRWVESTKSADSR